MQSVWTFCYWRAEQTHLCHISFFPVTEIKMSFFVPRSLLQNLLNSSWRKSAVRGWWWRPPCRELPEPGVSGDSRKQVVWQGLVHWPAGGQGGPPWAGRWHRAVRLSHGFSLLSLQSLPLLSYTLLLGLCQHPLLVQATLDACLKNGWIHSLSNKIHLKNYQLSHRNCRIEFRKDYVVRIVSFLMS